MQNPFLLFRIVLFFSVLIHLGILTIIFASWNVHAASESSLHVPAASVLLILNSLLLFICAGLGILSSFASLGKAAHLKYEVAWSVILAMSQLGGSVDATIRGPQIVCQEDSNFALCASAALLVPTVWISTILLLVYCSGLFVSILAHITAYPDIWHRSADSVNWFDLCPQASPKSEEDTWTRYLNEIDSSSSRKKKFPIDDAEKAPWATRDIRRGVDDPFTKRDDTTPAVPTLPTVPQPAQTKDTQSAKSVRSRFIERFCESKAVSRPDSVSYYGMHFVSQEGPFPSKVENQDLPIPIPRRLSDWIRADKCKGITVHSSPHSRPNSYLES